MSCDCGVTCLLYHPKEKEKKRKRKIVSVPASYNTSLYTKYISGKEYVWKKKPSMRKFQKTS